MFAGFEKRRVSANGIEINLVHGGKGPALLLLHGHPQTHVIWHRIAEQLAEHFTVVATDLRGYGDSGKPEGLPDHSNYSKRTMAQDQVDVMRAFGHEDFLLVGHDRGGRVAYRLALDHPERVKKLVTLDIAPTLAMYEQTTMEFAKAYFHWFLLIQPAPFPETLINADPEFFLRSFMSKRSAGLGHFAPEAFAEYLRCFKLLGTAHGICEDYRQCRHRPGARARRSRSGPQDRVRHARLVGWGWRGRKIVPAAGGVAAARTQCPRSRAAVRSLRS